MTQKTEILFPVARLVMGSLTEPQVNDAEGKPLLIKNGPNAGQARSNYFLAIAVPKGAEKAWWETPWGAEVLAAGQASFPQLWQSPKFAWKIEDGDSTIPNTRNVTPASREGFPGHWIVRLGSGYAPKTYNANGTAPIDPEAIKLGHYVEVLGTVDGNGSTQQPGVYINHSMIAHSGFGPEIYAGPDPTLVGFGRGALPAGASATPASALSVDGATYTRPGAGALSPSLGAPGGMPSPMTPTAAAVAMPIPVTAAVVSAPLPPGPPVPTAPHLAILRPKVMLPSANGATYESFVAAGWTDDQMIAQGFMQA